MREKIVWVALLFTVVRIFFVVWQELQHYQTAKLPAIKTAVRQHK